MSKLTKLINNPNLFFKDFWIKRSSSSKDFWIRDFLPVKDRSVKFVKDLWTQTFDKADILVEYDVTKPIVSIIVPIYNVEKYLEQCLLSIQKQTYSNLQIILINDGSPDKSLKIAKHFCKLDSRFIVHTKKNGGLSAARNTGIELATGEYIWFIDSDDIIQENAVKIMMESLLKTGSDFVVGCYCRFNMFGYKKAGSWVQEAHIENQEKVTLKEYPDILVNATAWSKLVKYDFLIKNELYFPVGVLYEDQLWSTKLYSSAHSFDILKDVIYDWRVRDDNSSISQQSKNVDNLSAILIAIEDSLNELNSRGLNEVAQERAVQFLSNNMREYLACLDHTDDVYMERLSEGVISITKHLSLFHWKKIPAHLAAIEWLLLKKDYCKVNELLELGTRNINTMSASYDNGDVILQVPYWDSVEVNFPKEVLVLKENQYKPNVELRRAYWCNQNELCLEGWAFIPLINPEETDYTTSIRLISNEKNSHIIELSIEKYLHPQLDRISNHQLNNYKSKGFKCILEVDKLKLHPKAQYKLQFIFKLGSLELSMDLTKIARWGAAGQIRPSTSKDGRGVRIIDVENQPWQIGLEKKSVFAEKIYTLGNLVLLEIKSKIHLKSVKVLFKNTRDAQVYEEVSYDLNQIDLEQYQVSINVNWLPTQEVFNWLVRAVDINGKEFVISWPFNSTTLLPMTGLFQENRAFFETGYGNVGICHFTEAFEIKNIKQELEGLSIVGRFICSEDNKADAKLTMKSQDFSISCEATKLNGDEFSFFIPFAHSRWNKETLLSTGRYELVVHNNGKLIKMMFSSDELAKFPKWLSTEAPIVARLERHFKKGSLVIIVQPSISLMEQGARNKQKFIESHQQSKCSLDENAVLFRTYYGESTTCNALAIHQELYRRNNKLKLYWSVKDSSVLLPEGAIPVIENSKAWYEMYSTAKYIIDNTHQPDFFEKKQGQVIIATFHGYPFKKSGIPYWNAEGFSRKRIESFLKRHNQWDYLLSPAPYATPILAEVFPSTTAKMLEIGYPRNDIFFSKEKAEIRKKVRFNLGIDDRKKVILYAPTYRDNLAQDEFRARMIDYLDIELLLEELGDNYVVLVRGHMINARMNENIDIDSTGKIIDVTKYPEISDLCLASDIGILDYSSLRFDYILTGNPMIFFVPDLDSYLSHIRGSLVPYTETAPGPFVKDTKNVAYWIKNIDKLNKKYNKKRKTFISKYMPLEDGKSSQRFVDEVFKSDL